jgi:hypothetical protein
MQEDVCWCHNLVFVCLKLYYVPSYLEGIFFTGYRILACLIFF